jgi:hypothetical protein
MAPAPWPLALAIALARLREPSFAIDRFGLRAVPSRHAARLLTSGRPSSASIAGLCGIVQAIRAWVVAVKVGSACAECVAARVRIDVVAGIGIAACG